MSFHDLGAETPPCSEAGVVLWVLDPLFGLFIWAAHLLPVYILAAVACQLGLGTTDDATRTTFLTALTLVTAATAAAVVLHAVLRYRRFHEEPDQRFRMNVTIGGDAIAVVAVMLQFLPILLTPLCA